MSKLTDTQLVVLNAAAGRIDRCALPLPAALDAERRKTKTALTSLIKCGLLEARMAASGDPIWREEGDERLTLAISEAGLAALNIDEPRAAAKNTPKPKVASKTPKRSASPSPSPVPMPRPGTKLAALVDLLRRKDGATVDEIMAATEWQAHSVRGAISGAVKKKLGLTVTSELEDGRGRVYRIAPARKGAKR